MKIKITNILDWEEDTQMMDGDASHEGWRAVQSLLEEERVKKIDEEEAEGLPFVCEAKDEDEARDYVENNLEVNECTMYLDDDEDLVDDYEEDCMSYDREVEFVNDTGEVYEED